MNPQLKLAAALLLATLNPQLSTCFAQGSLTPPGAPAPTMKTLAQIEPRTPVSSAPYTISAPGSYYLTTNLTVATGDAITIATNGVTLDLSGFTISSTAASATGTGIMLSSGWSDVTICNGHIRGGVTNNGSGVYSGSGFAYGIYYSGNAPANVLVSRVSVSGCRFQGINLYAFNSTAVESCTVRTVGGYGIMAASIKGSVALDCGSAAIYGSQVADSRGTCTGSDYGLYAYVAQNCVGGSSSGEGLHAAYTAQNCYGYSTSGNGLYAATAQSCYGQSSSGTGLYAGYTALNCWGYSSTGYGLSAQTAQDCYGQSDGNGNGLTAEIANNCHGESGGTGPGLYTYKLATGCVGSSVSGTGLMTDNASFCVGYRPGGTAIDAAVATGCHAVFGTNHINFKYNMP